jgi:hypothetical protein
MVNDVINTSDAYRANSLVYSKRRAAEIAISRQGIPHTRKGVQELGSGWLFISSINLLKSKNLLTLAYRNSSINSAAIHSKTTCLLSMVIFV